MSSAMFAGARTRSEESGMEMADAENLLYIANLDEGFAILGADDRVEPVYAIMDEGSLGVEDFERVASMTDEQAAAAEEAGEFVTPIRAVAMKVGLVLGGNGGADPTTGFSWWTPDGPTTVEPPHLVSRSFSRFQYHDALPIQLPEHANMGQDYPLNRHTPVNNWPAGCGAVAVAQLFTANYTIWGHNPGIIGGTYIDWNRIYEYLYEGEWGFPEVATIAEVQKSGQNNDHVFELSNLVGACGRNIHTIHSWWAGASFAGSIAQLLRENGYTDANDVMYSDERLREMLINRLYPTIMYGDDGSVFNGHYWLVDGYLVGNRTETAKYSDGTTRLTEWSHKLAHCNWGWFGNHNGWFNLGVFYYGRAVGDVEDISTVPPPTRSDNLNHNNKLIMYSILKYGQS